jgi:hypothetical protein
MNPFAIVGSGKLSAAKAFQQNVFSLSCFLPKDVSVLATGKPLI